MRADKVALVAIQLVAWLQGNGNGSATRVDKEDKGAVSSSAYGDDYYDGGAEAEFGDEAAHVCCTRPLVCVACCREGEGGARGRWRKQGADAGRPHLRRA